MSRCLTAAELARLEPDPHLDECDDCRAAAADQRAVRALVGRTPAPPALTRDDRERLAAEVMAASDQPDIAAAPRGRRATAVIVLGAALAAAAALVVSLRTPLAVRPPPQPPPPTAALLTPPSPLPAPAPPTTAAIVRGAGAQYHRAAERDGDVVRLRDGAITVDSRGAPPVRVSTGGADVRVDAAEVRIVARDGVLETVTVIAGTAEVVRGRDRQVVEAGFTWEAPAPEQPPREASAAEAPADLPAFAAGWSALRARRYADAIAAFDRATDPAVAEDAAYWAAVASERAGHADDAVRRFEAFLVRFPDSPRVESVHTALARLDPSAR